MTPLTATLVINRHTPLSDLPELLRVPEVAAWMDANVSTVYGAIASGALPHVRLGRLVRVPRTALQAWAQGHRQTA